MTSYQSEGQVQMDGSDRRSWIRAAIICGAVYFLVGFIFSEFDLWAGSNYLKALSNPLAFLISGSAFAIHIGYEHFRLHNTPRVTAWHTAIAVALSAFALALKANIHDLGSAIGYRSKMLIALPAWPILTGVPAFIVALLVALGLSLTRRRT